MTTFHFSLFHGRELLDVKATLRGLRLDLPEGLVQRVEGLQRGSPERLSREAELAAEEAAARICELADRITRERLLQPLEALELAAEDFSQAQRERYDFDRARPPNGPYYQGAPPPWR
jgi:hypothetical protein